MKNLIPYCFSIILVCTVILTGCGQSDSGEEEASCDNCPNVVLIFTDDLGYGDVSCYNPASKVRTPHLDNMAAQGMRFTDAHTSAAVCTPSRYSLLTGRYCWRTGHKSGVQGGYDLPLIEKDQLTIGRLFQENGYETAAFGKWHVGMEWTLKEGAAEQDEETVDHTAALKITPLDQGFDYFFGTSGCTSDDGPFAFIVNDRIIGHPLHRIEDLNVVGDGDYIKDVWEAEGWAHEKADTTFTNRAIEFMEIQHGRGNPFFVYLALSLPHIPWLPADFVKGTTEAGPREEQVALIDYCMGEIDSALIAMGIMENTLVIFSSDNGPRKGVNGHQSAGKLRGYKGSIFEGGHRVPLIIRWPGRIEQDSRSDETVCMTDFIATFAAILGDTLASHEAEDSYNLLPVMLQQPHDTPLRSSTVHHSGGGAFAIRKGDWKMIFGEVRHGEMPGDPAAWNESGSLFNMKEDPYETQNLYDKHPEIVKEMNALLESYLSE